MKNSKAVFSELVEKIRLNEPIEEKESMARILMEDLLGVSYAMIMTNAPLNLSAKQAQLIDSALKRVNGGEPVQYVTGVADFYGKKFFVDRNVLIPRPETEELVAEVIRFLKHIEKQDEVVVVDIGTGSGCIPITLATKCRAKIYATDVSDAALTVAKTNSTAHQADVEFMKHDILHEGLPFKNVTVVVSNPPYIAASEQKDMKRNVAAFEPHLALFVPDENPLVFYERIAVSAREALVAGGMLITEINERFGSEVKLLFQQMNFQDVDILRDLSGKERIVKGLQSKV